MFVSFASVRASIIADTKKEKRVMEIHRTNNTRATDNYTDRIQTHHGLTKDFKVVPADAGLKFEAKCMNYTWSVSLTPEEAELLRKSFDKS